MTATALPQIPARTGDTIRGGKIHLPHVDLVVCHACELRCVGCTNGMGMLDRLPMFKTEEVLKDIANASRAMSAEKVCLLGGEALLHKDIVILMRAARALSDVVQVLTNGIALHRMTPDFWEELDWLKISVYPGKTPEENVALARRMQDVHGFELDFYPVAEDPFRAVLTKGRRQAADALATFRGCWFRTYTRKIERGFFWRCCTSPSISQQLLGLPPETDGIALDGLTSPALGSFLARDEAMESCFRCHGNTGPRLSPWSEERDREAWKEASAA